MRRLLLTLAALLLAVPPAGAAPARPRAKAIRPAVKATRPAKTTRPAAPPARGTATAQAIPDTPEAASLRRAFRFAFPIYEFMRTRSAQLARARAAGLPDAVNTILPRLTLADATTRDVTTPNNDTLYGSAWLDLTAGPVILTIPALPGRYHSAALMALTTDNTAILGTRTGGTGGRYAIVGPGWTGPTPEGAELVRSASNDAWLLIRVLVNGPDDVAAAAAALGGFQLGRGEADSWAASVPTLDAPANADAKTFLAVVAEALARSAANPDLAARATALTALPPETAASLGRHLLPLRNELKPGLARAGEEVQGWSYPRVGIGEVAADDDLRSFVAVGGLAALPRVEAMYLTARADKDGAPLTGARAYRVNLPANLPVGAFWSLTMYSQEPDGRLFFVPNPLDRFAVGDRAKHLRSNRDGSYDIFVQAARPAGERVVNWLPAPPGKFVLVFRAYLPRAPFLDGSFRLPPVEVGELVP